MIKVILIFFFYFFFKSEAGLICMLQCSLTRWFIQAKHSVSMKAETRATRRWCSQPGSRCLPTINSSTWASIANMLKHPSDSEFDAQISTLTQECAFQRNCPMATGLTVSTWLQMQFDWGILFSYLFYIVCILAAALLLPRDQILGDKHWTSFLCLKWSCQKKRSE